MLVETCIENDIAIVDVSRPSLWVAYKKNKQLAFMYVGVHGFIHKNNYAARLRLKLGPLTFE